MVLLGRRKDWTWAQLDSVVGSIGGTLEGNPKLGNLDSPTCHFASFMAWGYLHDIFTEFCMGGSGHHDTCKRSQATFRRYIVYGSIGKYHVGNHVVSGKGRHGVHRFAGQF